MCWSVTLLQCLAVVLEDGGSRVLHCYKIAVYWCYKMGAVECGLLVVPTLLLLDDLLDNVWTLRSAATSFNWISYEFPSSSPPLLGHRYLDRISYGLTSITSQGSLAIPVLQIMIAECTYLISGFLRSIGER